MFQQYYNYLSTIHIPTAMDLFNMYWNKQFCDVQFCDVQFCDVRMNEIAVKYVNSSQIMDIIEPQFIEQIVKEEILLPSVILPNIEFDYHYDLDYHNDLDLHYDIYDFKSITIMMLVLSFTIIIICLNSMLCENENREIFNDSDEQNLNGRYRYICRGKGLNNKRCKRCVKNATTCYQHI
jgi:hypothetical protein